MLKSLAARSDPLPPSLPALGFLFEDQRGYGSHDATRNSEINPKERIRDEKALYPAWCDGYIRLHAEEGLGMHNAECGVMDKRDAPIENSIDSKGTEIPVPT